MEVARLLFDWLSNLYFLFRNQILKNTVHVIVYSLEIDDLAVHIRNMLRFITFYFTNFTLAFDLSFKSLNSMLQVIYLF